MFNNYFTTYLNTESPPIVTDEYLKVKDNYLKYNTIVDYLLNLESFYKENNFNWIPEFKPFTFSKLPSINEEPVSTPSILPDDTKVSIIPEIKTHLEYVSTLYTPLRKALEKHGIDGEIWTPILLAHTSIESGWGNKFSRENNNFGGIKGKGSVKVNTQEWNPEKGYYTIKDTFKSYDSVDDFADDYVKKLKYKFKAFDGTPDEYLKNIRKYGYFTARLEDYLKMMNDRLKRIYNLL